MKKILRYINFNVAVRFIGLISVVIFQSSLSLAEVPEFINYQGRLVKDGIAVNGTKSMKFRIVNAAAQEVWSETQNVTVNNGIFSVKLGSVNSISAAIFNTAFTFLEVIVEGTPLGQERLVTVPYAYRSREADHSTLSDSATNANHATFADTANVANLANGLTGDITISGGIAVNYIELLNYGQGIRMTPSFPLLIVDGDGVTRLGHHWRSIVAVDIPDFDGARFEVVRKPRGPVGWIRGDGVKAGVFKHPLNPNESIEFYAIESPKISFEDFGEGKLQNGTCRVTFDNKFHLMISNTALPNIQLTPLGDCKGFYVSERTSSGFVVKELQDGKSNVSFSWKATAFRREYEDVKKVKERWKIEENKWKEEKKPK